MDPFQRMALEDLLLPHAFGCHSYTLVISYLDFQAFCQLDIILFINKTYLGLKSAQKVQFKSLPLTTSKSGIAFDLFL